MKEHPLTDACPARAHGLELRAVCSECDGTPECGRVAVARGELVYVEDDRGDTIYVVVAGVLRETRSMHDGHCQGIRLVRPGQIAGSEALLGSPYQCSLEAVTAARLCKISVREVFDTLHQPSKQGWIVAKTLAAELMELRQQVLLVGPMSAEERVLATLRSLTADTAPGAWTRLALTRQEIADLLGLAQATVSRVVQRFARRGLVEVKGRWLRFSDDG